MHEEEIANEAEADYVEKELGDEADADYNTESNHKPESSKSFWGNPVVKTASTTLDAFIQKKSKNK